MPGDETVPAEADNSLRDGSLTPTLWLGFYDTEFIEKCHFYKSYFNIFLNDIGDVLMM